MRSTNGIVAGGRKLILTSQGYKKKMEAIRKRIEEQYADEYAAASGWSKFNFKRKIEREIQKEQRREEGQSAPPHALYLAKKGALK